KAIVSRSPLTLIEKILSLFINVKKIDLSVYEEIQRYSGVDYDPTYTIKKMIAQYTTMKWLLKLKKPKVAFISPAYTAFGYVKALKESGVIVVEMQHGLILKSHHGYNVYTAFDQSYFPDYLLSFGKREKDVFDEENKSLSSNQIIPVGNFFLDHVTENYKEEGFTEQQSESYKLSIAVSLQEIELGEKLIPFIIDLANANQDVVFYLKPRRRPKAYFISKYDFPNNTVIVEHVNIYELILNTDCHATIFSTTALEAPALGRQNVLVNINNKAKEIFGDTLTNSSTTVFVDDIASFQNFIDSFQKIPSEQIKQEHEDIIASNFKNNVNQFLKRVYA
ncbi:MAG: hypothetical protein R3279_05780, partial [Putridiphycobacter sp.]|nr:hypothetical protein [Putridiphycobacter sp.]